jgi:hypothetical protein
MYHSTLLRGAFGLLVYITWLLLKEYPQAEGILAGFRVDLELASDLSCGIGVSEMTECWEKVQRTSARPHVDLVPGGNGTGTCLTRADM